MPDLLRAGARAGVSTPSAAAGRVCLRARDLPRLHREDADCGLRIIRAVARDAMPILPSQGGLPGRSAGPSLVPRRPVPARGRRGSCPRGETLPRERAGGVSDGDCPRRLQHLRPTAAGLQQRRIGAAAAGANSRVGKRGGVGRRHPPPPPPPPLSWSSTRGMRSSASRSRTPRPSRAAARPSVSSSTQRQTARRARRSQSRSASRARSRSSSRRGRSQAGGLWRIRSARGRRRCRWPISTSTASPTRCCR